MAPITPESDTQSKQITGQNRPYAVTFLRGGSALYGTGDPVCTFAVEDESGWRKLLGSDAYQLALAFTHSQVEVDGDLIEAIKIYQSLSHRPPALKTIAAYLWYRLTYRFNLGSSARQISFHYDRSNDFYTSFLDSRMVYSCAYFKSSESTLDAAQLAKLDHICRKLRIADGDRFLDVGCGWGALLLHAAGCYGAIGTGCTLSHEQRLWATDLAERQALSNRISILECDYRALRGKFDKIASVGMFEHVGPKALQGYFNKVAALLADGGVFLNHGIVRPEMIRKGPETLFLAREVFPGGELVRLSDVIRCAEYAGLEVFDIENLRPHYHLTCRAWVSRLVANRQKCIECVGLKTYKTWLLYLAASAASFEAGRTEIHQALFVKRAAPRPFTRDYIYH